MRPKTCFTAALGLAALAAFALLLWSEAPSPQPSDPASPAEARSPRAAPLPPHLQGVKVPVAADPSAPAAFAPLRAGGAPVPHPDQRESRLSSPLWLASDAPFDPPIPLLRSVLDWQSVTLDLDVLSSLAIGDRVPIVIPGHGAWEAVVENQVVSDGGDRCWRGHLAGHGKRYPIIYTQGFEATFGTFVTPQGVFALEALGEKGTLYLDTRDGVIDPNQSCELFH